jgi:hypothetical protein
MVGKYGTGNQPCGSVLNEGTITAPSTDYGLQGWIAVTYNGTNHWVYKDGAQVSTNGLSGVVDMNDTIRIGAYYAGGASDYSDANLSTVIFGDYLTAGEHDTLYNAVQAFNAALSRQV